MQKVRLTVSGDVQALKLGPGDKVVVTYHDHRVSRAALVDTREQLQKLFPLNEVIVIGGGCIHVVPAGQDIRHGPVR